MSNILYNIAHDIIKVLPHDDIALDLDLEWDEQPNDEVYLQSSLIQFLSDLDNEGFENYIEGFGRSSLRKLINLHQPKENLPRDVSSLKKLWLRQHHYYPPEPPAPQRLFSEIKERLNQEQGSYHLAKTLAPELERVLRHLLWYYLTYHSEENRKNTIFDRLSRFLDDAQLTKLQKRSSDEIITRLGLSELVDLLQSFDQVLLAPYCEGIHETFKMLTIDERQKLQSLGEIRNRTLHGRGNDFDGSEFCRNFRELVEMWCDRLKHHYGPVPRGAVISEKVEQRLVCYAEVLDEHGHSQKLNITPSYLNLNDQVLLSSRLVSLNDARNLKPLPKGSAWETPNLNI